MHLGRTQVSRKIPVPRTGTRYLARALSHVHDGVPVVVALREMLALAHTAKEVKKMVNDKMIKINGRVVHDIKEPLRLFNVLSADKQYLLTILPTGRFDLVETKESSRLCKVTGKTMLPGKNVQLNLHDGTNLIHKSKEKILVGDSVMLNEKNTITSVIAMEKGRKAFVISGRRVGLTGKVHAVHGKKVQISFDGVDKEVELDQGHVIVQ